MEVVGASNSRRRRAAEGGNMIVVVEVGDPPAPTVSYQAENVYKSNSTNNDSLASGASTQTATQSPPVNYTGWWNNCS